MKPELDGGEWTPPATTTPYIGNTPGEDPLAELQIRRLANRHGHARLPARRGGTVEICPDPAGHARDVAAMARVLEAAGFVPYPPGRPPAAPDGCRKPAATSYRRPGA